MRSKFENLRTYLPATKEIYDAITFNYLMKQKDDELYLGEHLYISRKSYDSFYDTTNHRNNHWAVFYKGEEILRLKPKIVYDGNGEKRNVCLYELYFTCAPHTKFTSEEFFKFDQETKDFLRENYYYEHTIIKNLVKMLKNHVIRMFGLSESLLTFFNNDSEMFDLSFEDVLDEKHREVALYLHDAYYQRIPLFEKSEIENIDELKVKEK